MAQIPNLFSGISQQAPALRHPAQAEEQINAMSSVSQGITKRPPTEHKAQLYSTDIGPAFVHYIDRDDTERYVVVITDGDLKVFDADGTAKTVAFPDGKGYLDSDEPRHEFAATTVADHTFIANKTVLTAMTAASDTSATPRHSSIVKLNVAPYEHVTCPGAYVSMTINSTTKSCAYSTGGTDPAAYISDLATQFATAFSTWTVYADSNELRLIAPPGTTIDVTEVLVYSTDYAGGPPVCVYDSNYDGAEISYDNLYNNDALFINCRSTPSGYTYYVELDGNTVSSAGGGSDAVATNLTSSINGIGGFSATRYGTLIKVTKNDSTAFTWATWDGYGSQGLQGCRNGVVAFGDLPNRFVENYPMKIQGESLNAGAYYMEWNAQTSAWSEVRAPGIDDEFDASTMPHLLVRESDGTFTFKEATWAEAQCGDVTTAPNPSFIGATINDVFFFRNRLGLLSGENVIMSRASEYYDFWPLSATDITDADPIDTAAVNTRGSDVLLNAQPFNDTLLLFSTHTQFRLSAQGNLTPKTVRIDPTTAFATDPLSVPIGIGPNLYFVSPRGEYSQVREYFVEPDTVVNDAADVTAHVNRYLPTGIFSLVGSSSEDMLLALSETAGYQNRIYVYRFYWQGQEKLQSSWSHWETGADDVILGAGWLGTNTLALVIQRSDGVYLESMLLNGDASETVLGWRAHIDRRVSLTGVYNSGTDTTSWTLPYEDTDDTYKVVLGSGFTGQVGRILSPTLSASSTLTITGDFSAASAYVGKTYTMRYRFSEQFQREVRGNSEVAVIDGRFQLRRLKLRYEDTGFFKALVTVTGRDPYTYTFTGKIVGATFIVGQQPLVDGTFSVPLNARSSTLTIDVINDSPLPSTFLSADVEGIHVRRNIA